MRRVQISAEAMPERAGDSITLPESAQHHLRDVLRMTSGDQVEVFDGAGSAWVCAVDGVDPMTLTAQNPIERTTESPLSVTLLQAIPKGERWEWLLEKATELGVHEIVPLETARTVVSVPEKKLARKLERWERIVSGAARQSHRVKTPILHRPMTLGESLENRAEEVLLYAHPGRSSSGALEATSVAIWVGPEGGFTDDELHALETAGAKPLGLGPRVLRSETAGMFACGLVQSRWGDIG